MVRDPDREALRRLCLERRDATSSDMLDIASGAIRRRLRQIRGYARADAVGAYRSIGSEIRTDEIIQDILNAGQRLFLPAVSGDSMVFREVRETRDTVRGRFDVMEPRARCPEGTPDILLVPAVCVTLQGGRLGYGRGYYDAYLRRNGIESVATCLDKQVVGRIPGNPGDVPADWIVTENRLRRTGGRTGQCHA